jgi:hypothetical protein
MSKRKADDASEAAKPPPMLYLATCKRHGDNASHYTKNKTCQECQTDYNRASYEKTKVKRAAERAGGGVATAATKTTTAADDDYADALSERTLRRDFAPIADAYRAFEKKKTKAAWKSLVETVRAFCLEGGRAYAYYLTVIERSDQIDVESQHQNAESLDDIYKSVYPAYLKSVVLPSMPDSTSKELVDQLTDAEETESWMTEKETLNSESLQLWKRLAFRTANWLHKSPAMAGYRMFGGTQHFLLTIKRIMYDGSFEDTDENDDYASR